MQTAEIELKFPVSDLADLQSRLPGLGFHLVTPRTFEQNTLYDTPERTLRAAKQILRIRQYGDLWTLTHKRPADPSADGDPTRYGDPASYKVRIETETRIDDGPTLGAIFERLGYAPVFRYEKFRTEWSYSTLTIDGPLFADRDCPSELFCVSPNGHLVLDETPIGNYAELEGPPEWIDRTLAQLGVDPAICLTDSYGSLFLDWKQRTGSLAEHLTFDEIVVSEVLQPALG
jgi:adenylate cyclase class 2